MPPRTLNAPIGVWFSCLTKTSAPMRAVSRGHSYCGVGGTADRTIGSAASISARVNRGVGMAKRCVPSFFTIRSRHDASYQARSRPRGAQPRAATRVAPPAGKVTADAHHSIGHKHKLTFINLLLPIHKFLILL